MRAYCTPLFSMSLGWASGSAATLPLQPNHKPPWVWNTSRNAIARPPAAPLLVGSGTATRFETTTRRGKRLLRFIPLRSEAGANGGRQSANQSPDLDGTVVRVRPGRKATAISLLVVLDGAAAARAWASPIAPQHRGIT